MWLKCCVYLLIVYCKFQLPNKECNTFKILNCPWVPFCNILVSASCCYVNGVTSLLLYYDCDSIWGLTLNIWNVSRLVSWDITHLSFVMLNSYASCMLFPVFQISHKYMERRLLVAEACGALAAYIPVRTPAKLADN